MQNPGTHNARRRTPTMKIRTSALFATAFLAVGSVSFANSIPWLLSDSDESGALLDIDPIRNNADASWQFVFLTDNNGTLTDNGGGQEYISYEEDESSSFADNGGFCEGTWSDNLDETAKYVVALWDGVSGSPWYAISDGEDYITIDAAAFAEGYSPSPDDEGAAQLEAIIQGLLDGDYVAKDVSSGDEPAAPLAQQPSVSAFAVTGDAATLTIGNAVSGAWYAVFASDTPDLASAKTLLGQAVQAEGETLTFTGLDAAAAAKFYFVSGASTKDGAEVWQ